MADGVEGSVDGWNRQRQGQRKKQVLRSAQDDNAKGEGRTMHEGQTEQQQRQATTGVLS
jgi:hypothetical protein